MTDNIFLSLGSNIGDRLENLSQAVVRIQRLGRIDRISSVFETKPVGLDAQADFLNLALNMASRLSVEELHGELLSIEKALGRVRSAKNGPRIIDIDIIFFNQQVIESDALTIPHPQYIQRNFVLAPLAEIAPNYVCPWQKKSVKVLYENCQDTHFIQQLSLTLRH